jgi:hypothetical protein
MGAQRATRCVFLFAFLTFSFTVSSFAQTTIGLYTDEAGSSCSFSGNDPGVVTAYVVVRPDAAGVRGARFAASVPSCLGSVYLGESEASGFLSIGNSQTGVSISGGDCLSSPAHLLTISYFRSGSTEACCAYPIGPDPFTGLVEVTTCAQTAVAATPVTSHFNANASCPCADDVAPLPPSDPFPLHETINTVLWPTFHWNAIDWDGDLVAFDVYFGTTPSPPLVATVNTPSWEYGQLNPFTTYYWRVVARDALGHATSGPLWQFRTRKPNHPPVIQNASPSGGASIDPQGTLTWTASDPDGDVLLFDVYVGTTSPPPFAARVSTQSYRPQAGFVVNTNYYWRVVATDEPHSETSTNIMTFTTVPLYPPPIAISPVFPANNATNVETQNITLAWTAVDDFGGPVLCDLYFANGPPVLVQEDIMADGDGIFRFHLGPLSQGQTYLWRVTAHATNGNVVNGGFWNFATVPVPPPPVPSAPQPPDGSYVSGPTVLLQWTSSAPAYRIYFGRTNPPPLVGYVFASSVSLTADQQGTYYWQVVALGGSEAPGPIWSFTVSGPVPVLFSSFDAKTSGTAARLSWELQSDEAMQSYTIYRRTGNESTPVAVTSASTPEAKGFYVDRTVEGGKTYRYEMVVKTHRGDEYRSPSSTVSMPVLELALEQNHPNPFNPQTTIPYVIPSGNAPVRVRLIIYDASGRTVRLLVDEDQSAGAREIVWRGDDNSGATVSSGIYFCVLQAGKERRTQKLVLLK